MPVTLEQVVAALDPEEPDFPKAATTLGPGALPHLERLIAGDHPMLASKAAYLTGLIGTERSAVVLQQAARSGDVRVRIAAAAAAGNLPPESASDVLLNLIDDVDVGVQKVALRAVPATFSAALRARIESLSAGRADTPIRSLSREVLGRQAQAADSIGAATPSPKKNEGKRKKAAKGRVLSQGRPRLGT